MTISPAEQPPEPCDVLVVDDDFALSEGISYFLGQCGLDVRQAHDASAALNIAVAAPPRVAILDYQLPDATGVTLAAQLHAALPALHIILMSANSVALGQPALDEAGIKVFVNKPMPPGPLRHAVLTLLEA
jgi:DNA-binding response OmpR family regulator